MNTEHTNSNDIMDSGQNFLVYQSRQMQILRSFGWFSIPAIISNSNNLI